ncbi:MAG: hypothetical protein ACI7YS_17740 [Flavobacterium sp.]
MPNPPEFCLCSRCKEEVNKEINEKHKMCHACFKVVPVANFSKKGKSIYCKKCTTEKKRNRSKDYLEKSKATDEIYIKEARKNNLPLYACSKCNVEKPKNCFSASFVKRNKKYCRSCQYNQDAIIDFDQLSTRKKNQIAPYGQRWCPTCLKYYPIDQFYYHNTSKNHRSICKDCHKKTARVGKSKAKPSPEFEQGSFYELWKKKYMSEQE